jgi:hypothetical protein
MAVGGAARNQVVEPQRRVVADPRARALARIELERRGLHKHSFTSFCDRIVQFDLSDGQRALTLVAFDGVEPKDLPPELQRYRAELFGADVDVIPPAARAVLVAVCGARGGKTRVLVALYCLWRVFTADLSTLAPGEQAVALIVAPNKGLARQALRYARGAALSTPVLSELLVAESADVLVFARPFDGAEVRIEVLPATRGGGAVRGRSLVCAALDECAFFQDSTKVVNDVDVFKAITPRVLPDGMTVLASTPFAEAGLLHDEWDKNYEHPVDAMGVWAPTLTLLDSARNRETVAKEEVRDPANAEREFGARFMPLGTGLFFDKTALRACLDSKLPPRLEAPRPGWCAGVGADLGLVRDAAAFVAVHRKMDWHEVKGRKEHRPELDVYFVTDLAEEMPKRGKPLKLSAMVALGEEMARRHGERMILSDGAMLEPAREHLEGDVQLDPAPGGHNGNNERYRIVKALIHDGRVKIPAVFKRLVEQLEKVVAKPKAGGDFQIVLARTPGSHLDLVPAFVLAVWKAYETGRFAGSRSGTGQDRRKHGGF